MVLRLNFYGKQFEVFNFQGTICLRKYLAAVDIYFFQLFCWVGFWLRKKAAVMERKRTHDIQMGRFFLLLDERLSLHAKFFL